MTPRRSGVSWTQTFLHIQGRGAADCHTYPDRTPILEIPTGSSVVKIVLPATWVDDAVRVFARELAEQAHAFALEVERLHHTQQADRREEAA
ncbi:hypothetical protein Ssi03_74750 [Sphaerisporangium siamense]|uniref:Uncharacterized protein n=1 Tax=Sphaerisporangium siamense TaxID=795645 RepID=A0A7W7D8M4_9ACTN|nr:hypothetical protein [Sphaerisporangium siamense]MBB4702328.1 hypothetical protein [Sphaerisporangium siamense]GII89485.1 hypothetical protein Ssi03_74750 [Sphaerisporangium siamense]